MKVKCAGARRLIPARGMLGRYGHDFASCLIESERPRSSQECWWKIQGLVAKRFEDHRPRWFLQDFGLFLAPGEACSRQFGRNAIRHANDEVIAWCGCRVQLMTFFQKVAIGNEDVHAVRFPIREQRPQIYDASKMAVRVNNIANFDFGRQKDQPL